MHFVIREELHSGFIETRIYYGSKNQTTATTSSESLVYRTTEISLDRITEDMDLFYGLV
jgi:hypothetical protein